MPTRMTITDPITEGRFRLLPIGRCEEALREIPDNSFHSVVTDPPYGLSVEPDMAEVLKHWLAGDDYEHSGAGFMGRSWDSFVPGPSIWREIYRVLKPGGMLAAFAGTRTADLMGIAIRLAGFERRDTVLHIGSEVYVLPEDVEVAWVYGTGFPKEGDLGVAVDEHLGHTPREVTRVVQREATLLEEGGEVEEQVTRSSGIGAAYKGATEDGSWKPGAGQEQVVEKEPVSEEGKRWQGWSTVLKPSNEPIILARKPLGGKTVAANLVSEGVGGFNIAGAALSGPDEARVAEGAAREGRWPPNVAVSHTAHCRFLGMERKASSETVTAQAGGSPGGKPTMRGAELAKPFVRDGVETVEVWECFPGCQVRAMDEQGQRDQPWRKVRYPDGSEGFTQGVARFMFSAKPTRKEKDAGITGESQYVMNRAGGSGIAKDDYFRALKREAEEQGMSNYDAILHAKREMDAAKGVRNTHLTVKPIALMRWLVRLLTPPDGVVLDPFMGSGSTGCAAMLEGIRFVGCELEEESWRIAKERIEHWEKVAQHTGHQASLF